MSGFTIDNGIVDGQTIAQWTQDWWTWALNLPTATNPFTHPDGNFAGVDNNAGVYFIAGASQTHAIDVPYGTPLLVPLVNSVDTAPEATRGGSSNVNSIHATENLNTFSFDRSVTSLFASIDGVDVPNLFSHRVDSTFFDPGTAQAGTLATDAFHVASVGDDMSPAKSGGYWLMIDGLSPGQYTLNFGGTATGLGGVNNNYTDIINVLPPV